jgi:hypothetical protein
MSRERLHESLDILLEKYKYLIHFNLQQDTDPIKFLDLQLYH